MKSTKSFKNLPISDIKNESLMKLTSFAIKFCLEEIISTIFPDLRMISISPLPLILFNICLAMGKSSISSDF